MTATTVENTEVAIGPGNMQPAMPRLQLCDTNSRNRGNLSEPAMRTGLGIAQWKPAVPSRHDTVCIPNYFNSSTGHRFLSHPSFSNLNQAYDSRPYIS